MADQFRFSSRSPIPWFKAPCLQLWPYPQAVHATPGVPQEHRPRRRADSLQNERFGELAQALGVGTRCVQKALNLAEALGYIRRYREYGHGGGRVIEIILDLARPKAKAKAKAKDSKPARHARAGRRRQGPGTRPGTGPGPAGSGPRGQAPRRTVAAHRRPARSHQDAGQGREPRTRTLGKPARALVLSGRPRSPGRRTGGTDLRRTRGTLSPHHRPGRSEA